MPRVLNDGSERAMTPLRALGALRTCEALRFDGVRGFAAARREVNTRRNVCEEWSVKVFGATRIFEKPNSAE